MKHQRFYFTEALIALPLLVVIAASAVFFFRELPRLDREEDQRIESRYREIALDVRDGDLQEARELTLEGAQSRGRLGKKGTWGYEAIGEGRVRVWYRRPRAMLRRAIDLKEVPRHNVRLESILIAGSVLIVVLLLTNIGIRRFRRFLREREDFIAATAHDLKTPLAALRLQIGRNDEVARNIAARMARLVTNLTDFLKLGGVGVKPECKAFDVRNAFDEAYSLFRGELERTGKSLPIEGEEELIVMADETLVVQILWNLIANEIKYALPIAPVRVRFSRVGEFAEIAFIDEGDGLSARDMKRVFERYYRARNAMNSGKGGFGIGLSTAREMARAMGGDLKVAANHPKGCVFTLTLKI